MKLSILIRTIETRKLQFSLLYEHLKNQVKEYGFRNEVEILFECDNKQISVGKKAQNLLEKAQGKYVVFIDDDDWVPFNYCGEIIHAITQNPDCVGFKIECSGTAGKTASASNQWLSWADNVGGFDYVRTIYHKNPIKREIALQIGYKDMRFGEDHDYSKRLKESGLLRSEVFIDEFMYHYRYKHEDPATKYGSR